MIERGGIEFLTVLTIIASKISFFYSFNRIDNFDYYSSNAFSFIKTISKGMLSPDTKTQVLGEKSW